MNATGSKRSPAQDSPSIFAACVSIAKGSESAPATTWGVHAWSPPSLELHLHIVGIQCPTGCLGTINKLKIRGLALFYSLFRRIELSYPAHEANLGAYRSIEPLVGGPKIATELLRERQVVGIVDGPLVELACQFQRPYVKARQLMQFEPRP